jgi:hypothetical protein
MRLESIFLVFSALFFSAIALSACQTMSAEECALADWRSLGYSDASGSGATRFADRQESCARKGFAANFDAYQVGQREGLRVFCEPARAFAFASRGGGFGGSCAADQAQNFSAAFADGRRVYEVRSALNSAQSEYNSLSARRDQIDRDIYNREQDLRNATTDEDRQHRRDEINRLRRERHDTVDDMRLAQDNIALRTDTVERLRYDIGDRWGAW